MLKSAFDIVIWIYKAFDNDVQRKDDVHQISYRKYFHSSFINFEKHSPVSPIWYE